MKHTKIKLLSSIATLLVCFAMLLGSTYAWFTDKATTGVNKIEAGTLKIGLEMKDSGGNWTDAEGKKLAWQKASSNGNEAVLWEPGATYELPALKVTNKGNLALQFKTLISSLSGDKKLLNALEFKVEYFQEDPDIEPVTMPIEIGENTNIPVELPNPMVDDPYYEDYIRELGWSGIPLETSAFIANNSGTDYMCLKISATMKPEAGNEYQCLSLSDIAVTVVATQLAGPEYDSFDNTYDKDAEYPLVISNSEQAQSVIMNTGTGSVNVVAGSDIVLDLNAAGGYYDATLGNTDSENVTIDAQGNKITFDSTYRNAINSYGKLTISNAEIDSTYKPEGSTWDDYALIFKYKEGGANEVVFNNVTFNRQVAIEKGVKATFNNCTINQTVATGDMYALWIQAGADVTLNNCTITSINPNEGNLNRAIKIADEYVGDPTVTNLTVNGTTIASQKKAAVLVTSTAGANIVWGEGNNISQVAADTTNAVWNDADRTAAWDLVNVTGCTKYQEQ